MIDTQAIRNKILDLALRGMLTEQLPEDGTAEELFQQIQQKKQTLEKAGKIKKAKPLPPISDEEKQIDIPGNWLFCKLGDLSSTVTDGEHQTPKRINTFQGYYLLSARNVRNGYIDLQDVDYVDKEEYERISQRCNPRKNDVLISCSGSVGRCAVVADNNKYCMVRSAAMLSPILVESKYIMYSIQSAYVQNQIQNKAKQTLQANLFQDAIKNLVIMLPPLTEQCRIIAQIESTFSILDTIDALQAQYHDNLATLKSKLINAGIQGKLTEQLPEDGTAEELYQQIQQEKQSLEKAGKIKKSKPLPPVSDEEKPFDIPENWKWVRIGDVFTLQAGKNIATGEIHEEQSEQYCYPCYGGNGLRGYVDQYNVTGSHALIGRQGALCGNINFAEGTFYATEHAVVVYEYASTNTKWAGITLKALNLNQYATSVAQPGLAVSKIDTVPIPLPPLAEQKRIVIKLEELLPLCERNGVSI